MEELKLIGYDLYKNSMKKDLKIMVKKSNIAFINSRIWIKFLDLICSYISTEAKRNARNPEAAQKTPLAKLTFW